jgi:hypothetical protein
MDLTIILLPVMITLGVSGYCGLSNRISQVEAMQKLLLRKHGYDDDSLKVAIKDELNNNKHKKQGD